MPISAFQFIPSTLVPAIEARTSTVNVAPYLQQLFDYCSDNNKRAHIPAGLYNIDTSLYVTRTQVPSGFKTNYIQGDGGGYVDFLSQTTIKVRFNDKPGLIINQGRGVVIENIQITGQKDNIAPSRPTDNTADYVPVGMRTSAQSPYCGIAFDPTSGSIPVDGGYPGLPYDDQNGGSKNCRIIDCSIRGFVVGIMVSPGDSEQGEQIIIDRCELGYHEYAYSSGQPQARACVVSNSDIQFCRIGFEGSDHGSKQGVLPIMENNQFVFLYRCFECSDQFGIGVMRGSYIEQCSVLGTWGFGFSRAKFPMTITESVFKYLPDDGTSGPPFPALVMENHGITSFTGCHFVCNIPTGNFVINFAGSGRRNFYNCTFQTQWRDLTNSLSSIANTFDGSPDADFHDCVAQSLDDNTPFDLKDFTSEPTMQTMTITGGNAAVTYTDTEIEFDCPEAGSVAVGQLVLWQLVLQGNKSLDTVRVPALSINNIAGTIVTMTRLFDRSQYNETDWHFGLTRAFVTTRTPF